MHFRPFSTTGRSVSEIGLGTWQLGGTEWGEVPEADALATLTAAAETGVTFIDTADIYGMGRSESLIGKFLAGRPDREKFFIATKLGQHPRPGQPDNFRPDVIRRHTEDSLRRLGVASIDLTQTHSLSTQAMQDAGLWNGLRAVQKAGLVKSFGASVETMDQALLCLDVEGLQSLQIIFNIFRQKPAEVLFEKAQKRGVAIIVRLALASGLLGGGLSKTTRFVPTDHRNFNRDGAKFNVGETFAGLPFEKGVELVEELRPLVPAGFTLAQFALRWCLDFDAVTVVIPGGRKPAHIRDSAGASDRPPLPRELHEKLRNFYRERVAAHIRGGY